MKQIDFESITLRSEITSRGGGMEIDLTSLGYKAGMTAYQNYLGGGMLARVEADCSVPDWCNDIKLVEIAEQLKEYFFGLTNPDTEWEHQDFEFNQHLPASAY
jgi:hypothetical protein